MMLLIIRLAHACCKQSSIDTKLSVCNICGNQVYTASVNFNSVWMYSIFMVDVDLSGGAYVLFVFRCFTYSAYFCEGQLF